MSSNPYNQSNQLQQQSYIKVPQFQNQMNYQPNQPNIPIQKQPIFQNIQPNNLQIPQQLYESQQFIQQPPQVQMMDMFQKMMSLMIQNGVMNPSIVPLQPQYQVNQPPIGQKQVEDRFNNQISDMKSFYNMQSQQGISTYSNQDLGKSFINQEKNQNALDSSQILHTKSDFLEYDINHNSKKQLKSNNFQQGYDNEYNEFIQTSGSSPPYKETNVEFQYLQNKENLNKNQENQNNYFKNKKISQIEDVQVNVNANNFSQKSNLIDPYFHDKSQDYSISNQDYQNLNSSINQNHQFMTEFDDYVIGNHDQNLKNTNQSYNEINNISPKYQQDQSYLLDQNLSRKNLSIQEKQNNIKDNLSKIQNNSYLNNDYDEIPIKKQNKLQDNFINNSHANNQFDEKPIKKSNKFQNLSIEEKPVNKIDDIPINVQGSQKNFEQMIEEQLEKEQEAIRNLSQEEIQKPKKQFLKKQTRTSLSNANIRSKAATQHIQAIQEQCQGEDVIQAKKQNKINNKTLQLEPKQQKNSQIQQSQSQIQKANISESEIQNDNIPKKNFLKRGEGKLGTGKNGQNSRKKLITPTEDSNQQNIDDGDYLEQNSNQEPKYEAQKYLDSDKKEVQQYDFDDDKAWNDNEVKIDEKEIYQSRIVDKYFGGGKQNQQQNQNQKEKEQNKVMIDYNNLTPEIEKQIVEKYMNDKIEELNREVEKFKLENERVKKMRTKYEDLLKQLNKQKEEFQKQKDQEIAELEEWKNEEKKKTRNEKKLLEKTRSQLQNIPNRKERDEIENYKKEIQRLKDEMKAKDQRTKLTTERMKKQMDELIQINKEQSEEIKTLEYQRLESKQLEKKTSSFQIPNNSKSVSKIFTSANDSLNQKVTQDLFKIDNQNDSSDHQEDDDNNDEIGSYEDIINVKQGVKDKKQSKQPIFNTKKTQIDNTQNSKKQEQVQQQAIQQQAQTQFQQPKIQQNKQIIQKSKSLFELNQKYGLSIKLINDGLVDDNDFSYDQNQSYIAYQAQKSQLTKIVQQNVAQDGKIQRLYADGKKEIVFHNGVKKESFNDGYTIVHFTNQDIKQTLPCGTVIYYFAEANTTQTTIPNGPNIYKFANNQIEMHLKNGTKEIKFSDGTEKRIQQNGEEYTRFNDGTVQKIDINKIKTIEYPNGQTEIMYPDGTKMRKNADDDEFGIIEEEDDE